jgi:hypothetical protein
MKYILLIIFFLTPFVIRADEPRHRFVFTSANEKFELRFDKGEWALIEKATKNERYRLTGNISSMTNLVSDDGESVVAIDDYSEQDWEKNPEVLIFFSHGKKIKSYKLNELFDNPKLITVSVSHFHWAFDNEKTFLIKDAKLNLTTYELNNFVFDSETGNLLKKEKDEILSGNSIYVYGKVNPLGGDKHEILVECVISGSTEKGSKILFESKKFKWIGGSSNETLIIKDGILIARKGVIFNKCD